MNQRFTFFSLILLFSVAIISYRVTYALFSSSASNNGNIFSASTSFPTAIPTPTTPITPTVTPTPTPSACQLYCQQTYNMSWTCVQNNKTCGTGSHNVGEKSPCSPPNKDCCCFNP